MRVRSAFKFSWLLGIRCVLPARWHRPIREGVTSSDRTSKGGVSPPKTTRSKTNASPPSSQGQIKSFVVSGRSLSFGLQNPGNAAERTGKTATSKRVAALINNASVDLRFSSESMMMTSAKLIDIRLIGVYFFSNLLRKEINQTWLKKSEFSRISVNWSSHFKFQKFLDFIPNVIPYVAARGVEKGLALPENRPINSASWGGYRYILWIKSKFVTVLSKECRVRVFKNNKNFDRTENRRSGQNSLEKLGTPNLG